MTIKDILKLYETRKPKFGDFEDVHNKNILFMYKCLLELGDEEFECSCGGPLPIDDPDYGDEDYYCRKCYSTGIIEISEYTSVSIIEYLFDHYRWRLKEEGII